jgi:exonuclease III
MRPPPLGRVLTANIAGRRRVPQLRQAIERHRPDVVVVTEAYHARAWLLAIALRLGYRLRQYSRARGAEAPGIAVLVKRQLRVVNRWPMRMGHRWTWRGRVRRPRVYPALVLADGSWIWRLLAVHLPPGGPAGENAEAWAESWRRAASWLSRHDQAAAPGDWNALARELAGKLLPGMQLVVGTKVDHMVTVGLEHRRTERLSRLQPQGMHGWVLYTVAPGRRAA